MTFNKYSKYAQSNELLHSPPITAYNSHRGRHRLRIFSVFLIFLIVIVLVQISEESFMIKELLSSSFTLSSESESPSSPLVSKVSSQDEVLYNSMTKSFLSMENEVILSSHPYNLLRDVSSFYDKNSRIVNTENDDKYDTIPYFWHIHKSGGSSMKHIFSCFNQIQTRRIKNVECSDADPTLNVCTVGCAPSSQSLDQSHAHSLNNHDDDDVTSNDENPQQRCGTPVINVDASTLDGIERAIQLGLSIRGNIIMNADPSITSAILDSFIIDTSRVYEALPIFTKPNQGLLFTILRDPIDRVISKYYYKRIATWERNYQPQMANMTLMDYASSDMCDSNWVTRRLVHKMRGDLTLEDLNLAKDIIRHKTLVLFLDDIEGGIHRLRQYFGWGHDHGQEKMLEDQCLMETLGHPINQNHDKEIVEVGSDEWEMIREKNLFDIQLVLFAREVYVSQGIMLFGS